jgi:hypothetical protein
VPLSADPPALRRIVLAIAVLHDLELEPWSAGVVLRDGPPVELSWHELREAAGPGDLESRTARLRVLRHLRGRRLAADTSRHELGVAVRPMGYPAGHPFHPGAEWVVSRVAGGALELGLGFAGLGDEPETVAFIPPVALAEAGFAAGDWWAAASVYLERMGRLTAERVTWEPHGALRPFGDCDVVTLLGARALREELCARDPAGMVAAAVPMHRRGWLDVRRIDPAFAAAAAEATDEADRGFSRPVLLTPDEVALASAGGHPAELALRDPAAPSRRTFRWR